MARGTRAFGYLRTHAEFYPTYSEYGISFAYMDGAKTVDGIWSKQRPLMASGASLL